MEGTAEPAVVDGSLATKMATAPREIVQKRQASDAQVTSFQAAMAMPDLLDPPSDPPSSSDPSSSDPASDPSGSDDTSPLSFLGTPYSTSQQFDYPFPISNAPRDPAVPPTPLPSALPIASSLASAPSIMTAAASSEEASEAAATSPLPSMVSTIAASLDLPNNISELRTLTNQSSSSLNSTHSGHTNNAHSNPVMIPVASSGASIRSFSSASPAGSLQSHSQVVLGGATSPSITSPPPRHKGRHSLSIFPMPPPSLSIHTNIPKPAQSPPSARRPKAMTMSSTGSTNSEVSQEAKPMRSRPPSGSHSSLSIASMQLLSGPGEPPIPPSLLTKLNRPRNTSSNSNTSSYFSITAPAHHAPNSRDFFSSPGGDMRNVSTPSSPNLPAESAIEFFKPSSAAASKSGFTPFRPLLGRSNSSAGPTNNNTNFANGRPFFNRSSTNNPQLQSRAYAQHLRHQQQQQLKLQEEQRKKAEKERKEKEKKEKKEKKGRRSSLSLTRSQSSSSSSSAKTKSSSMSKSPSSSSIADGFKLSPTQRSIVENAISESEGSASPEGSKGNKIRRRSSVRRVLEKTGSLVGFNLNLNAAKRAVANPST
ncbi:hypothetical protein M408DRAFT_327811 [Serendipita vermifera MAFF 305830]|uniref:Uncharacterized protein n=1 Tax=Serendipita vermifera MAFF 305830 TaxID=933852 RepID=A0A0C3BHC1_SERVB|nr:hypothetical protein M408DRAFT_327811 [Serendipita vermifera MAFF 305830]